jgi:hypothetical protein
MVARHKPGASHSETSQNPHSPEFDKDLENVEGDQTEKENSDGVGGGLNGLKVKLKELEARKRLLAASQLKVEEDILAVQRTLQLCGSGRS